MKHRDRWTAGTQRHHAAGKDVGVVALAIDLGRARVDVGERVAGQPSLRVEILAGSDYAPLGAAELGDGHAGAGPHVHADIAGLAARWALGQLRFAADYRGEIGRVEVDEHANRHVPDHDADARALLDDE